MSAAVWYYAKEGHQHGPVSMMQLSQLAASGNLVPGDLVWSDGHATWFPAAQVPDLFSPAVLASAAPPSTAVPPPPPPDAPPPGKWQDDWQSRANASLQATKAAVRDTWRTLRQLFVNPVGKLPDAYRDLGPQRALEAGLVCSAALAVVALVIEMLPEREMHGGLLGLFAQFDMPTSHQGNWFLFLVKLLVATLAPSAALVLCIYITRRATSATGTIHSDVFLAGMTLVPITCFVLLAGLLGMHIREVLAILSIAATTGCILILFSGLTRLYGLAEGTATLSVVIILTAAAWLTSVAFKVLLAYQPPLA